MGRLVLPAVPSGERRVTLARRRVVVAVEHIAHDGPRGGKVEFYFENEGPQPYHQRMSSKRWRGYVRA